MLETTDDAALLVTESIVHDTSYTTATIREIHRCPSISWESSSARRWLNGDFIDKMDEWSAQRILSKKNTTYDSAFIKKARSFDDSYLKRHTEYEPQITIDRAFCLDPFEATKYFRDAADRICNRTGDPANWCLRSYSREVDGDVYRVNERGDIGCGGYTAVAHFGIRPAVWIKLP